ncbi:transcriptional regulator, partial [Streptomyces cinnamoneus]
MTQSKDTDPYADPRAFYGSELKRLREGAGLTQEQLGQRVFCSASYIGQFETAVRRPQ